MTDELAGLLARAKQLEQENASLRVGQSPGGDDSPSMPRSLAEFSALSPAIRRQLAHTMTPDQRDELLGRGRDDARNYL